jgi:hypothetical protein
VNNTKLMEAIADANWFLAQAEELVRLRTAEAMANKPPAYSSLFPLNTGAVRRASMDLTRSLAQLRKSR